MAQFTRTQAAHAAVETVKAALQSGSIKLNGPALAADSNARTAELDATYLATVINKVADAIAARGE